MTSYYRHQNETFDFCRTTIYVAYIGWRVGALDFAPGIWALYGGMYCTIRVRSCKMVLDLTYHTSLCGNSK